MRNLMLNHSETNLDIIAKTILIDKLFTYKIITHEEACKQLEDIAKLNYSEIKLSREEIKEREEKLSSAALEAYANRDINKFMSLLNGGY